MAAPPSVRTRGGTQALWRTLSPPTPTSTGTKRRRTGRTRARANTRQPCTGRRTGGRRTGGRRQEAGAQEAGAQEAGAQEAGAQEAGAQEAGAQEAGAQEAGAQEAGAQEGVDQDGPLPLSALAKIDPWRGGYDAIIGWVPELAGREAKVVERLAAEWPGRVVALFDQALLDEALLDPDQLDPDRLDQDKAGSVGRRRAKAPPLPSFSTPGARALVVSNEPTDREETARQGHRSSPSPRLLSKRAS